MFLIYSMAQLINTASHIHGQKLLPGHGLQFGFYGFIIYVDNLSYV